MLLFLWEQETFMVGVNDLLKNEPLGKYTTFKIGGPADYFYDAKTVDEFVSAIVIGRKLQVPFLFWAAGQIFLSVIKAFADCYSKFYKKDFFKGDKK